jgi:hypothetical protein
MRKRLLAAAVCAVGIASLTAGSAFAGEITGNGKYIAGSDAAPLHGQSECAYSGQNDEYQLGDTSAPRTQSWGSDFASEGVHAGVPGTACNPTRSGGGE